MEQQGSPGNSISGELAEILAGLSKNQLRFVSARQECATKKEAAEKVGLNADTVYRWPEAVERAVELVALVPLEAAIAVRRRALLKAMLVKVEGLEYADKDARQKIATEIIDRELGGVPQTMDVTSGGERVGGAERSVADIDREILELLGAAREGAAGGPAAGEGAAGGT